MNGWERERCDPKEKEEGKKRLTKEQKERIARNKEAAMEKEEGGGVKDAPTTSAMVQR